MLNNLTEVIQANEDAGHCWFSVSSMRFFKSRILASTLTPVENGAYFISSEDGDGRRLYTIRFASDDGCVETVGAFQAHATAKRAKGALKNLLAGPNYRWIAYFHNPLGGFEVERHVSIEAAKAGLVAYCNDTGFYADLQANGNYGCTGSLYSYTAKDWAEAEEYREIGNPFVYPEKLLRRGPKGGVRVENA